MKYRLLPKQKEFMRRRFWGFQKRTIRVQQLIIIRRALEAHGYNIDFKIRPYNPPVLRRIIPQKRGDFESFIPDRYKLSSQ